MRPDRVTGCALFSLGMAELQRDPENETFFYLGVTQTHLIVPPIFFEEQVPLFVQ